MGKNKGEFGKAQEGVEPPVGSIEREYAEIFANAIVEGMKSRDAEKRADGTAGYIDLKAVREKHGMTREAICHIFDVPMDLVEALESGADLPTGEIVKEMIRDYLDEAGESMRDA